MIPVLPKWGRSRILFDAANSSRTPVSEEVLLGQLRIAGVSFYTFSGTAALCMQPTGAILSPSLEPDGHNSAVSVVGSGVVCVWRKAFEPIEPRIHQTPVRHVVLASGRHAFMGASMSAKRAM